MSRRPYRRLGIGFLVLALLALGGYAVYWHRLAAAATDAIAAWASARQAEGWAVSHGDIAVTGFPFELRVAVPAPHIESPDGVAWSAPSLSATASPLAPNRIRLLPAGRQQLTVPTGGQYRSYWLEAGAAEGLLTFSTRRAEDVSLHLNNVTAAEGDAPPTRMGSLDLDLSMPAGAGADHTATAAALTAAARDVEVPSAAATALGGKIAAIGVQARLQGAVPTDAPLTDALARWRDDGGTIEIERLALNWQPLDLEIDGTLALDAELQPMLAMTGKVSGYAETVDTFVRAGVVRPEDGRSVKLVLAIMGRSPAKGGPPVITVPLTIQDQKFMVGPVVLMPVPRIVWPSTEITLPDIPAVTRSELPAPGGPAGR